MGGNRPFSAVVYIGAMAGVFAESAGLHFPLLSLRNVLSLGRKWNGEGNLTSYPEC